MGEPAAELLDVRTIGPETLHAWQRLAEDALEPNPFFTPGPVLASARHLAGGERDRLLVVRRGEALDLALPVRRVRGYRRVPAPTVRAWGHDDGFLDTPLLGAHDPEAAWTAALDLLRDLGAWWWSFEQLGADGPVRASLEAAARRQGRRPLVLGSVARPVVRRRAEQTYLDEQMSASQRRRLGRFRRRLERELEAPVEVVDRAADDLEGALDRFLALEAGGWKGEAGTALLSDPRRAAYFRETVLDAGRRGRAQLWELGAGTTVAAALCAVVEGDGVFHLKTAYDERFGSSSPGVQLEVAALEAFHGDPRLQWIDSCAGGRASTPSARLYPDRRSMERVLVPLGGTASRLSALGLQQAMRRRDG